MQRRCHGSRLSPRCIGIEVPGSGNFREFFTERGNFWLYKRKFPVALTVSLQNAGIDKSLHFLQLNMFSRHDCNELKMLKDAFLWRSVNERMTDIFHTVSGQYEKRCYLEKFFQLITSPNTDVYCYYDISSNDISSSGIFRYGTSPVASSTVVR